MLLLLLLLARQATVLTLRERRSTSQELTPREFIRRRASATADHLAVICLATDNIYFRH